MPKVKKKTTHAYTRNHTKRRGLHHKQSRSYVKAYAPYLPLVISIITSIFISMWQPRGGVTLAYATNTSIAGLLQSTNAQRATNARAALSNNSQLNQAAQAKAQDMVARDYWSHDTPDGKEPWVFIQNAGYKYAKAGENLAFGFNSESAVVNGWMNSQSHKDNLLDGVFTEVGFGTCLSDNFVNMGKQLIVVQHFAFPQTAQQQSSPSFTPQQKPYVASVCTKTTIPYTTEYVNDPNMYEGSTYESGMGWDGYKETCTADSTGYKPADYTSPPYNKKIYVGTKPKPNYSSQPKDYSRCNQFLGTGAYQACVDAINRQ